MPAITVPLLVDAAGKCANESGDYAGAARRDSAAVADAAAERSVIENIDAENSCGEGAGIGYPAATLELLFTTIPVASGAVIVPALLTLPPILLLLMVMPVAVGGVMPTGVSVPAPVLVTLPVTVEF